MFPHDATGFAASGILPHIESIAPVESTPVNTPASASIPQSTSRPRSQPRVPFTRRRWLTIALISFIITLLAGGLMTARIRTFLKANPPEVYVFRKVDKREFIYAGRPVTLLDDNTNPQTPTLVLSYGQATQRIPVTVANVDRPQRNALPGLLPHEDWLRVLRMARVTGETPKTFLTKLDKGEVPDRLILVARIPRPAATVHFLMMTFGADGSSFARADHVHAENWDNGTPGASPTLASREMQLDAHGGKVGVAGLANYSFLDGHASTLAFRDVYTDFDNNRFYPEIAK